MPRKSHNPPAEQFGVSCLEKIQNDIANVAHQRIRKSKRRASTYRPST